MSRLPFLVSEEVKIEVVLRISIINRKQAHDIAITLNHTIYPVGEVCSQLAEAESQG